MEGTESDLYAGHPLEMLASKFSREEGNKMALKALLIHVGYGTWGMEFELSITPFPGLGIRLDTYDMVNVASVIVGDPEFDVTCIVEKEGDDSQYLSEEDCKRLGFEEWSYP